MTTPDRAEELELEVLGLRAERDDLRRQVEWLLEVRQRAGELLEAVEAMNTTLKARAELLELRLAP